MSRFLTVGLFLVFLAGSIASWIPLPRRIDVVESEMLAVKLGRRLRIEAPQQLRPDETGWLDLTVLGAQDSGPVVITSRLDLLGLSAQGEDRGQVVAAGAEAHFRWKLHSRESGVYAGRLWIYAGSERELISAWRMQIEVRGPRMIWVWLARIGFLAAALVVCIFGIIRNLSRRSAER